MTKKFLLCASLLSFTAFASNPTEDYSFNYEKTRSFINSSQKLPPIGPIDYGWGGIELFSEKFRTLSQKKDCDNIAIKISSPQSLFSATFTQSLYFNLHNMACVLSTLVQLVIPEIGLKGFIPESLGECVFLRKIDLSHNELVGFIPDSLKNLSKLQYIDLSHNEFMGDISMLGHITSLTTLDLSNNHFLGPIPKSLGNLIKLQYMNLSHNEFMGDISMLGHITSLTTLDLSQNHLTGPVPESLGNLIKLQYMNLSQNHLTGPVPESLTKISELEVYI